MGFLDKAREAAAQATVKAQQGLAQGQAKIDEMQAKRHADALLRDLGAAYYAQQRGNGSGDAVAAALAALDAHVAEQGPLDTSAQAGESPAAGGAPPPSGSEGYGLDDL